MEETINFELTEREAKNLRELIAECIQKMRQAQEAMQRDKEEIAELQAATRAILAREWKAA